MTKHILPTVRQINSEGKLGIFRVESVDLTFSNGQERKYFRLKAGGDAVTVIAYDDQARELVLIEEYGCGTLDYELGFVRGGVDANEELELCAERELSEELGLKATKYTHLKSIYNSTGYQTGVMHILLAEGLSIDPNPLDGDEPEPLHQVRWSIDCLDELLVHERFRDARNLCSLYLVRDLLRERGVI